MSCHAILKNLHEPKMDVTMTISFKITAVIEITSHMPCVLHCRRRHNCIGVLQSIIMLFHSFIAMECVYKLFFTVSSSVVKCVKCSPVKCRFPAKVPWKRHKIKDFSLRLRNQPLWCSAGFESYSVPIFFSFLLSFFRFRFVLFCLLICVVGFYKYKPK